MLASIPTSVDRYMSHALMKETGAPQDTRINCAFFGHSGTSDFDFQIICQRGWKFPVRFIKRLSVATSIRKVDHEIADFMQEIAPQIRRYIFISPPPLP